MFHCGSNEKKYSSYKISTELNSQNISKICNKVQWGICVYWDPHSQNDVHWNSLFRMENLRHKIKRIPNSCVLLWITGKHWRPRFVSMYVDSHTCYTYKYFYWHHSKFTSNLLSVKGLIFWDIWISFSVYKSWGFLLLMETAIYEFFDVL